MKFRIDLKILFFLVLFLITGQIKLYFIVMIFALLHELAHLITGLILGFKLQEIELIPFGFWIRLKPKIKDYNVHILKANLVDLKYLFVTIAGPLLNLILAIIFENHHFFEHILKNDVLQQIFIYANLLIFSFNLVPIFPLDGGRILQSLFRLILGKKKSYKYINIVSYSVAIIITVIGSIAILYIKNIAVVLVIIYLWILVIREDKRYKLIEKMKCILDNS